MVDGRHFEKFYNRHISVENHLISLTFWYATAYCDCDDKILPKIEICKMYDGRGCHVSNCF